MDGQERRVKSLLDYWPLITVVIGGIVTAITTWNNINGVIAEQKAFKASIEERRAKTHDEMEAIRMRITKLEQWKEDRNGRF
jgi:hypothetical protein